MITFLVILILTIIDIYVYTNLRRENKDLGIRTSNNNKHLIELHKTVMVLSDTLKNLQAEIAVLNPKNAHAKLVTLEEEVTKQLRHLNDKLS